MYLRHRMLAAAGEDASWTRLGREFDRDRTTARHGRDRGLWIAPSQVIELLRLLGW
jgi:hypothetical protein